MSRVDALIPWTDRAGRLSLLKLGVFALAVAPALALLAAALAGTLGARPMIAAIHDSGDWSVRFLLLSLLVTPLRTVARWPGAIAVRRMLGLAAFAYAALHLVLYVGYLGWDLAKTVSEIVLRVYLAIGFVALAGLLALAATSTDGMIRRLGSANWNRLHALAYWIAPLALVHFAIQRKLDILEPAIMTGLFLWLMGWRALKARGLGASLPAMAVLAAAAAAGTALLEAAWLSVRHGFPFDRILLANLDWTWAVPASGTVLMAGAAALAVAAVRLRAPAARAAAGATPG
jgi:sulfoxide reductase heme-binding subunit YedZ